MSLRLSIDGARWRAHLRRTVDAEQGLVPVVKGRGYGIGTELLAVTAAALGVDTVAVGTPAEAAVAGRHFPGDLLVLEPWAGPGRDAGSPPSASSSSPPAALCRRVVRTVGTRAALDAVLDAVARGADVEAFVVEVESGMHRHGVPLEVVVDVADRLAAAFGPDGGQALRGFSLHLPVQGGRRDRRTADATAVARTLALAAPGTTLWVSHLGAAGVRVLRARVPDVAVRERVGTRLWLGDPGAFASTGLVLDVRTVRPGTRVGYSRRRSAARRIVVVSGGTAHGIGLAGEPSRLRQRLVALVAVVGGLLGVRLSPFSWCGRRLLLADPPHMLESMLALPSGSPPPEVGDRLSCRVRMTTTTFDEVVLVEPHQVPASAAA